MEIIVSSHAVDEYKKKMFSKLENQEIRKILETIVKKGTCTCKRPGGAWAMVYNGLKIVIIREGHKTTVITFLGNKQYSGWSQKNEVWPRYKKAAI